MFLIYVIILYLLFIIFHSTKPNTIINNKYINVFFLINMIFISSYIIITTDLNFTDRIVYSRVFNEIQNLNIIDAIDILDWEPLFIVLIKSISMLTSDIKVFYFLLHVIFLFILLKGIKNITSSTNITVIILFVYLNYSIYYGYTLNGLRQGFAIALLILAIGYAIKNKKIKMLITSILSPLFHVTVLPVVVGLIFVYLFNKIKVKYLLSIYIIFSILYLLNINNYLFQFFIPTDYGGYTNEKSIEAFGGSNKTQYLLFNTFFVFIYIYYFKNEIIKNKRIHTILIKMYLISSLYLLMLGYLAYANRIASYSWFLIPILIGLIIAKNTNVLMKALILLSILIVGLITIIPTYIL